VSVTVTVHVVALPVCTDDGVHTTAALVLSAAASADAGAPSIAAALANATIAMRARLSTD
jgi:hypothetical protein